MKNGFMYLGLLGVLLIIIAFVIMLGSVDNSTDKKENAILILGISGFIMLFIGLAKNK